MVFSLESWGRFCEFVIRETAAATKSKMSGGLYQAFIYLLAAIVAVPLAKRLGLGSVIGYLRGRRDHRALCHGPRRRGRRCNALRRVRRGDDALYCRTRTPAGSSVANAPADSWTGRLAGCRNGTRHWLCRVMVWVALEDVPGHRTDPLDVFHRHRVAIPGRARADENAGRRGFLRGVAFSGYRRHSDYCPDAAAGHSARRWLATQKHPNRD